MHYSIIPIAGRKIMRYPNCNCSTFDRKMTIIACILLWRTLVDWKNPWQWPRKTPVAAWPIPISPWYAVSWTNMVATWVYLACHICNCRVWWKRKNNDRNHVWSTSTSNFSAELESELLVFVFVLFFCVPPFRHSHTSNGGCRREEKSRKQWSIVTMLSSSVIEIFFFIRSNQKQLYVLIALKIRT